MRETPELLRWAIKGQDSWHGVVGRIIAGRSEMRGLIPAREEPQDLTPSQSVYRLSEIFQIVKDSS